MVVMMAALVMAVALMLVLVMEVATVTTVLVVAAIPIPDSTHVHQMLRVWQAKNTPCLRQLSATAPKIFHRVRRLFRISQKLFRLHQPQ
jgi:hypothetical protein